MSNTGVQSLNLSGSGSEHDLTRHGGDLFANWQGTRGGVDMSAQYVDGANEFGQAALTLQGAPEFVFPVRSPMIDGQAGLISASARYGLGGNWTLAGEVQAIAGKDRSEVSGSIAIGWRFCMTLRITALVTFHPKRRKRSPAP